MPLFHEGNGSKINGQMLSLLEKEQLEAPDKDPFIYH
jgi:hypothetical protein